MPEIERKFHVDELPAELGPGAPLRQAYVALDGDVEVRVRDDDGRAVLTVKGGRGLVRTEVEVAVDADAFDELWALAVDRRVEKTRHRVPVDGGTAEVDVYAGALAGLHTVEVEFDDEAASAAFTPPPWFGAELTGDRRWSNAALATDGRPDDR